MDAVAIILTIITASTPLLLAATSLLRVFPHVTLDTLDNFARENVVLASLVQM